MQTMKKLATIYFTFLTISLFSQKQQFDTLFILGHKYPLERTSPYFIGTNDIPLAVIKSKHKFKTKSIIIDVFYDTGHEIEEYDESGYTSLVELHTKNMSKKYNLWYFADTLTIDKQNASDLFKLKMSGELINIDQAQFIVSNDTCTSILSINSGSTSVIQKALWYSKTINPKYIYITSIFYKDKFKNVSFIPIQFCLKLN